MADAAAEGEGTLQQAFESGWEAQRTVDSGHMSCSSDEFKVCVKSGIANLERATHLVNGLSLFSPNESVEEVTTSDLKYFLLPALLGDLTLQLNENRHDILRTSRVYFVDYLQRCRSYSITTDEPPAQPVTSSASAQPAPTNKSYNQIAADRMSKIAQLKAKKEMERKIMELSERLKVSGDDAELIREHLITSLKFWVMRCQESVQSGDQEMDLLEGMERMRNDPANNFVSRQPVAGPPPPRQPAKPPLVITRNMIQGQVFGAGYPSLPAVSLDQFYEQQYREQVEKQREEVPQQKSRVPDQGDDEEEETEESLRKEREFDDFKDTNRRGWGNKKNMG